MLALVVSVVLGAGPSPVTVQWDPELADDIKRGGYDVAVNNALSQAVSYVVHNVGLQLARPVEAMVYAPGSYERAFGAAAAQRWWAHYRAGKIHINGGIAIDGAFMGLLTHEMTHAVLDVEHKGSHFSTWLNEGLAELFEHEVTGRGQVDDVQRLFLKDAKRNGDIHSLADVRAPLDANGYLQSFAAVSLLTQRYGRAKVMQLYHAVATGTDADKAWLDLGTDPKAFAKLFDAWVADYRG